MEIFTETETLLAILGILDTPDVTGYEQVHRLFAQRTEHLHELSTKTLFQIIEEISNEGLIPSAPHPRAFDKRIPHFKLAPAGRAYLSRELLRLEQKLVQNRLLEGEPAILKRIRALNKVRLMLRVLRCEGGVSAIQTLRKRLDEAPPS